MTNTKIQTPNTSGRDHVGPSLWHGREINSCCRCKFLRCVLRKSGRQPDYEYFCQHPDILSGARFAANDAKRLEMIKEKFPERVEHFVQLIANRNAERTSKGEFISNDSMTPETPEWCPVVNAKKETT